MSESRKGKETQSVIPTLHEMLLAYRKVKTEIWWMKSIPSLKLLVEYERDLENNLESLRQQIQQGFPEGISKEFLGSVVTLPKKLKAKEPPKDAEKSKIHFTELSDKKASRKRQSEQWSDLECRVMAIPSIDFQVLGVLWTMREGGDWDAQRSTACRANVMRRQYLPDDESEYPETESSLRGPINKKYPGVFKPYFHAYKNWRNDGLKKAEQALKNGQRIFALTLDLQRYYHQIDVSCLRNLRPVSEGDRITEAFYCALEAWQKEHGEPARTDDNKSESEQNPRRGIPVGLIASAVVGNAILQPLDEAIEEHLSPIYYGRYVDDLFLVFSLNGNFCDGEAILEELKKLMERGTDGEPRLKRDKATNTLSFDCKKIWCKSVLTCKAEKQRLFLLEGQPGADLLKVIDSDLREQRSEWRMVPELDQDDDDWLKESLVASQDAAEGATTLRRADGLSIRRLGVAVALRKLEAIERFGLESSQWKKQRQAFYEMARTHIFTLTGLCDFWPKLPALFGLVFANEDWDAANKFLTQLIEIKEIYWKLSKSNERDGCLSKWLVLMIQEELMRSCPKVPTSKEALRFFERFEKNFGPVLYESENLEERIQEFQKRDLDRIGFRGSARVRNRLESRLKRLKCSNLTDAIEASEVFLNNSEGNIPVENHRWLIFPTRPLGEIEISLAYPEAAFSTNEMQKCLYAIRGQERKRLPTALETHEENTSLTETSKAPSRKPPKIHRYKSGFIGDKIRVAIANFKTEDNSWISRVRGNPDLSISRLSRLLILADDFLRAIKQHSWQEKPLYFVLPELSIPSEWIIELAGYFSKAGVSLIAGAEYEQGYAEREVINPAYLFLSHKNLGYPSTWGIRQIKTRPAPAEAQILWQENEISLARQDIQELPTYVHGDFHFGVLICSELTDAEVQYHFRGHVDAMFCLEWNPDIDTFDGLVRAATQTVHCFLIQVNNRNYGDSRIRAPGKKSYERDLARIHGGIHDSFVVGELTLEKLRNFQRRVHSDLNDDAPYKPLPSGYNPSDFPRLK